jgi:gamma-glutamylcyclotransferase (GGCT)/AIG2-like uncharacterized protein YtfP
MTYAKTHPHLLFVYGTLKMGHGNNRVITEHDGKFVGTGATRDLYTLASSGIPFMWRPTRSTAFYTSRLGHVVGELWRVNDEGLIACDRLEGHPRFYVRTPITVMLDGPAPTPVTAGAYIIGREPDSAAMMIPDEDRRLEWGRDEVLT